MLEIDKLKEKIASAKEEILNEESTIEDAEFRLQAWHEHIIILQNMLIDIENNTCN